MESHVRKEIKMDEEAELIETERKKWEVKEPPRSYFSGKFLKVE
jgi:hypothetical protein